jgi:ankyrin repeat protein
MDTGATPLYIAAHNGHLDVIRDLVEVGADKDKAMDTGATPLYIAAVDKLSG